MLTGKPYNKESLSIKRSYRVLEVGPGSNPTKRADVLVEKYISNNDHRKGNLMIYKHQTLIEGDAENLPFSDKEFDFVICSHVLEHAEHPELFIKELIRVAKRGYIETPGFIGEILAPKSSHKWVILEIDRKIVLFEKAKLSYNFEPDFGNIFLNYLPYQSLPFRLLNMTRNNLMNVRYLWENEIDFLINPQEEEFKSYFTKKWSPEMVTKIFSPRSVTTEIRYSLKAFIYFSFERLKRALKLSSKPIYYSEYINFKKCQK